MSWRLLITRAVGRLHEPTSDDKKTGRHHRGTDGKISYNCAHGHHRNGCYKSDCGCPCHVLKLK